MGMQGVSATILNSRNTRKPLKKIQTPAPVPRSSAPVGSDRIHAHEVRAVGGAEEEAAVAVERDVGEALREGRRGQGLQGARARVDLRDLAVLIVDDNATNRRLPLFV